MKQQSRASHDFLGTMPLGRVLYKMALPATIGMFVNALYNFVDTIFIGRGVGPLGIGGLTIVLPFQMMIFALALLIGAGASSIVSRALGAGEEEKAAKAAGNAGFMAVTLGMILLAAVYIFKDQVLILFGATEEILPFADEYLSTIMFGVVFITFTVSMNNVIRAEGSSGFAMITMLIGALSNIILDAVFIFGLDMGIRGAALATVIGRFLSFLFVIYYFSSSKARIKPFLYMFKPKLKLMRSIFSLGTPNFVRQVGASVLAVLVNNALRNYGGSLYISAYGMINRLMLFFAMPLFGVVQGFQPIAGYNYGARNFDRVTGVLKLAAGVTLVIASFFALITQLFPQFVLGIFTNDSELLRIAVPAVRIIFIMLPFIGLQFVGATYFMAIGKALPSLLLTMSRQVLILIPLVIILPPIFGVTGVWMGFPLSDTFSLIITLLMLWRELDRMRKKHLAEVRQ